MLLLGVYPEAYNCILCYAAENDQEDIISQEEVTPARANRRHNLSVQSRPVG
ncbi:MAG: hypothetical protein NTAFB01_00890 [Nitrospira sp.]